MNKTYSGRDFGRKRKAKNRNKIKKWKRSKLLSPKPFQGTGAGSENGLVNGMKTPSGSSKSLVCQLQEVLNLSPSKSECDTPVEIPDKDSFIDFTDNVINSNNQSDVSYVLNDSRYEVSSDEDVSYSYSNILEEFSCETKNNEGTEIVSADINFVNETNLTEKRKVEKKSIFKKESFSFDDQVSPPPQKKKKIDNNFSNKLFHKSAHCYYRDGGMVLILDENETVYFHGLCLLSVLHGQVEILGHTLTKNSPEVEVYSTRGSSLLYLKNITDSDIPVENYLVSLKIEPVAVTGKSAVVLCKELNNPDIVFVEKHISQQILPREVLQSPRIVFQPREGNFNLLQVNEKWEEIIEKIVKETKLMICGGKGVGKTTFLRYAINRLLMRFKEILIIDLDPGQSEFTIPGCISIVRINKPVFGVNYTHLQQTERSIISNINIAYEPDRYIASVKELINTDLDETPVLINYMGYTHGIGINILSAVISYIHPTDILQICSQDMKKNYKYNLKTDVVVENAKLFVSVDTVLNYNLHKIESMCDDNDGWTAEPRQLREMSVLAYISKTIQSDSIFKTKAPMYKIKLEHVVISDLNGEEIHPAAVNANLVALCNLANESERIFFCFGWGVVRGIDLIANELVLLTSESPENLNKVTHLVSNGVNLPPSIYMTPDDVIGPVPYVIEGTLMSLGQIPKRSRISAKSVN